MVHLFVVSLRLYYSKLDYNTLTNHEKEGLIRSFKFRLDCGYGGVVLYHTFILSTPKLRYLRLV